MVKTIGGQAVRLVPPTTAAIDRPRAPVPTMSKTWQKYKLHTAYGHIVSIYVDKTESFDTHTEMSIMVRR